MTKIPLERQPLLFEEFSNFLPDKELHSLPLLNQSTYSIGKNFSFTVPLPNLGTSWRGKPVIICIIFTHLEKYVAKHIDCPSRGLLVSQSIRVCHSNAVETKIPSEFPLLTDIPSSSVEISSCWLHVPFPKVLYALSRQL